MFKGYALHWRCTGMCKVVSFINMKGGVGKTTLSVNVGYTLSTKFDKKVLLIDVDPQMNATQYTLNQTQVIDIMENPKKSIYGVLVEEPKIPSIKHEPECEDSSLCEIFEIADNFHIIPSHLNIMGLNLIESPFMLSKFIKNNNLKEIYDVIILDSPPTISPYTRISLLASDAYIVPLKPDFLSLFGLPLLEGYISRLRNQFDHDLDFVGIILTMVAPEWRIYGSIKEKLKENPSWNEKLFSSELKNRTSIQNALSQEYKERNLPYIIELGDKVIESQMIDVTEEFMQRLRL
jgi:chromosome partitioning protein